MVNPTPRPTSAGTVTMNAINMADIFAIIPIVEPPPGASDIG